YTLILPSVSVGNVGQLATDLLVFSLNAEKIGYVWHPSILPVIGSNPYDLTSELLMISSEVYIVKNKKLVIIQIRSPLCNSKNDFLNEFLKWTSDVHLEQIVVLSSSFDYERNDEQICGTPLRYFMTKTSRNKMRPKLSKWKELECMTFPGVNSLENVKEPEKLNIPGGGFTKLLYQKCILKDVALVVLLKFCSEGDNIPDAVMLADYVDEWLDIVPKENNLPFTWSYPPSWKHLFAYSCIRIVYLCGVALTRALDSCIGNHMTKSRSVRIVSNDTYAVFSSPARGLGHHGYEGYQPCAVLTVSVA
ncbi:unnamed protein product, partial [Timema podura]|nr:unnamed protein product [Timema podura]